MQDNIPSISVHHDTAQGGANSKDYKIGAALRSHVHSKCDHPHPIQTGVQAHCSPARKKFVKYLLIILLEYFG